MSHQSPFKSIDQLLTTRDVQARHVAHWKIPRMARGCMRWWDSHTFWSLLCPAGASRFVSVILMRASTCETIGGSLDILCQFLSLWGKEREKEKERDALETHWRKRKLKLSNALHLELYEGGSAVRWPLVGRHRMLIVDHCGGYVALYLLQTRQAREARYLSYLLLRPDSCVESLQPTILPRDEWYNGESCGPSSLLCECLP